MFSCQCLNVSITVNDENSIISTNLHETLKSDSNVVSGSAPLIAASARIGDGKSEELACFFEKAIGPLQEANVRVQLTTLLKTIPTDGWDVNQCLNCGCLVFARDPLKSATSLLVNASLATTPDAVSLRMVQESYSPAYRILLDGSATDFRGFYRKDEYRSLFNAAANTLDSTNDSNELLELLRAFMRAQAQLANERIAHFTQELNEQLCNMRDRAEQDYLFLTQTFVPELEENKNRGGTRDASIAAGANTFLRSDIGDRRMDEGGDEKVEVVGGGGAGEEGGPVAAKSLAQLITNVTTTPGGGPAGAGGPGSQMETPPPTPECMPMSTGNSPPSIVHSGGGGGGGGVVGSSTDSSVMSGQKQPQQQQNSRASSISSSSFASDGLDTTTPITSNTSSSRPALSNSVANTINNNTTNRGAINKPPTQQQQSHSTSTNLFANHNSGLAATAAVPPAGAVGSVGSLMGAHRFSSSGNNQSLQHGSLDSDCLFDIDGMENDKTPPPDAYSDDDECDYKEGASDNNNHEGGMYIPRYQYGRQNSSIAKSLPISTPKPMTPFRGNDDDLEEMTEDNIDIAASIKAIAKSVHGDAVFGDLPRPQVQKFTSQI